MGKQTTDDFIRKARLKHGDKYSYAKSEYSGAHEFLTITCPVHGDFQQRAGDHANVGKGCKPCGVARASPRPFSTEAFVTQARARHGDRYDYSKATYVNYKQPVMVTCQPHGDFSQLAGQHLRGNGCPVCRDGNKRALYKAKSREERHREWREKAARLHAGAYDYSKVVFVNSKTRVEIVCARHGSFFQTPCNHLNNKCRCPECANVSKADKGRKSPEEWLAAFVEAHGDAYDYAACAPVESCHQRVTVVCPRHGPFKQRAYVHVGGHGCPKCAGRVSAPEDAIYEWLRELLPDVEIRRSVRSVIPPYELDIFLPELGLAVEFNGTHWHCDDRKTKLYHQQKSLRCLERGVRLLHIYDYDWTARPDACRQLIRGKLGIGLRKLHARALSVKPVGQELEFLKLNHFQGPLPSAVGYGLFDRGELVSIMTFGKPRYGDYDWELLRFCSLPDVTVRGGASRLFRRFAADHLRTGDSVVSYARLDYSTGGVYEAVGFRRDGLCKPDYVWVKPPEKVLRRYSTQKHRLSSLLGAKFDPSKSETENMKLAGYKRVYSAGNFRYVYRHETPGDS